MSVQNSQAAGWSNWANNYNSAATFGAQIETDSSQLSNPNITPSQVEAIIQQLQSDINTSPLSNNPGWTGFVQGFTTAVNSTLNSFKGVVNVEGNSTSFAFSAGPNGTLVSGEINVPYGETEHPNITAPFLSTQDTSAIANIIYEENHGGKSTITFTTSSGVTVTISSNDQNVSIQFSGPPSAFNGCASFNTSGLAGWLSENGL